MVAAVVRTLTSMYPCPIPNSHLALIRILTIGRIERLFFDIEDGDKKLMLVLRELTFRFEMVHLITLEELVNPPIRLVAPDKFTPSDPAAASSSSLSRRKSKTQLTEVEAHVLDQHKLRAAASLKFVPKGTLNQQKECWGPSKANERMKVKTTDNLSIISIAAYNRVRGSV